MPKGGKFMGMKGRGLETRKEEAEEAASGFKGGKGWAKAPGLAKKGGVPPGLAKKGGMPPGQAKKMAIAAPAVPKTMKKGGMAATASAAPATTSSWSGGKGWAKAPGLAKKGGVPPGLAKKGGLPPGQAKKAAATTTAAPAVAKVARGGVIRGGGAAMRGKKFSRSA